MKSTGIDHFVLTVTDVDATCEFYEAVLNAEIITYGDDRTAIGLGEQKVNLHAVDDEIVPRADDPRVGAGDFCVLAEASIEAIEAHLAETGTEIVLGPVERTGARGPMTSVYVRDPDDNLVEIATYEVEETGIE